MHDVLKEVLYRKLSNDKIKINWNKNPIKMSEFMSFLTVEVERSCDHLGATTGWTLLENKECKLRIRGGVVGSIEYLDGIEYGTNIDNPYNNFVNPFYLFDILTKQGQLFFLDYYNDDLQAILDDNRDGIVFAERQLARKKELYAMVEKEIETLKNH